MAVGGEVLGDEVGVGGGDEGLVGSQVVGEGMAALAVEFGENVV